MADPSTTSTDLPEGIFNVVLGTAGHIDHGKSTLVKALTGIDPDRLKEEQERGITIDLGFAPLELSNGLRAGIIDVPGHERFIKNMVAGSTGIDFVMLVVAADDGVMAQTREHLDIVRLLGVADGLTVITKCDLAEPGFADLVAEEIQNLSAGTCLEGKPVVQVSAKTGQGIAKLKAELERALSKLPRRSEAGPLRIPIQRVFAKEGFGTVVTGVPMSGHAAIGDAVQILPPGFEGRIKGLHAYKHKIERARAGHSTAVNVAGIDRHTVVRGMVCATPGIFRPNTFFTAHLFHLPGAPYALKHRAPVRFHAGTAELQGKVLLLEGEVLPPGAESFIQIVLEEPAVLCPGDRYILRHQSPVVTLGGGQILDNAPVKLKRQHAETIQALRARRACLGDPEALLGCILEASAGPKHVQALNAEAGLLPAQTLAHIEALKKVKRAVILKPGEWFASTALVERSGKRVNDLMTAYFKEHPALSAIERPELRARLGEALRHEGIHEMPWFDELLNALSSRGVLKQDGNQVRLAGHERKLTGDLAKKAEEIERMLKDGALAPPELSEIEARVGLKAKQFRELLQYLAETGRTIEAAPGVVFHAEPFEAARRKLASMFEKAPAYTTSEIRQELGMNRKYVVPLVETFDRMGFTVREGDKRRRVG